ncbi:hypothetical protein FI667_g14821, partial [Globisporangium splendens]
MLFTEHQVGPNSDQDQRKVVSWAAATNNVVDGSVACPCSCGARQGVPIGAERLLIGAFGSNAPLHMHATLSRRQRARIYGAQRPNGVASTHVTMRLDPI